MDSDILTPKEASAYTRIGLDALAQMRYRGGGPKFLKPTPRKVFYRRRDLDAWLAESERTSTVGAV